jgi:zinc transport system substrate-binding protein
MTGKMISGRFIVLVTALMSLIVPAVFSTSCDTDNRETELLGVVVTIPVQADFIRNVGGDKVDVTVMVPPGASPHTYEPTPGQMVKVNKAKVYAKVGSGVEFELEWMDKILEQNPGLTVIDCSQGVTLNGDDPHIWNSPFNAKKMVENIGNGLIMIDPENSDYYRDNMNGYLHKLDELDGSIHERLDGFTNRHFLIYHPAFGYFAAEYGLDQIPIEHGGKTPTPKVIQDSVDKALQYNLEYVFVAPQFSIENARTIAKEIGGEIAYLDPLPDNYIENMKKVADALAAEFE